MPVDIGATVSVATPILSLSLWVRSHAPPDAAGLPSATDVAGLLATMEALGRLCDVAVREALPVARLVSAWTRSPPPGLPVPPERNLPPDVPRVIRPEADVWWALRREFDVSGEDVPPLPPDMLRRTADWRDPRWRRPVRIERLHFGSPLEIVAALPWEWFGPAGGGIVFLKVLEHWLHSPQRIRTEGAGLRAQEAVHRATEAEAHKRALLALRDIEALKSVNDIAEIADGKLDFD